MQKKKSIEHTQLLVLSLLAGEDMYGYQMIVELARRSDRTFEMKEGTLYPVLHGLEPVSYTHLDVYKRQWWSRRQRRPHRSGCPTRCSNLPGRPETPAWGHM